MITSLATAHAMFRNACRTLASANIAAEKAENTATEAYVALNGGFITVKEYENATAVLSHCNKVASDAFTAAVCSAELIGLDECMEILSNTENDEWSAKHLQPYQNATISAMLDAINEVSALTGYFSE